MNWFKIASSKLEEKIIHKIKQILHTHPFFLRIMKDYHIPTEDIDNHLHIIFTDLNGKFSEANGEELKLDHKFLDNNLFSKNFHFIVHEFFHWIKRRSEAIFYLNDDEEVQSFTLAVAWEIMNKKSKEEIMQSIFPIIAGHFKDQNKAQQMFNHIILEAQKIVQTLKM